MGAAASAGMASGVADAPSPRNSSNASEAPAREDLAPASAVASPPSPRVDKVPSGGSDHAAPSSAGGAGVNFAAVVGVSKIKGRLFKKRALGKKKAEAEEVDHLQDE